MASVLEGFLVRLGFDVDKDGQKRFDADVDAASERIKGMAKHAVAAGTAIGAAFLKASSDVNSLYNATNFTGSSIRGFTALQKAVERVGGSGASVSAAFQSLARNVMTLGPGFEELLDHQLGVSLTDSVGKLRDMSDVFMDIRNKLAEINKVDPIQARQLASVVGLGDAFDAVMKKDFPAELERTRSLMGGFAEDVDKSADSTHRLMNELSNTWGVITGAIQSGAAQITDALDLDQKLKDFNDGFSIWMRDTVKAEVQMVKDSDGVLDWAQKWLFDADDYQSAATYKRLGEKIASGKATDDEKAQYEEFGKDDDVVEIASGKLEAQKEPQAVAPAAAPDQDGPSPIDRPVTIESPEPIEVPAQSVHVEPAANIEMPDPIEVPAQSVHVEPAANIEMPDPIEVPAQSVHVEPAANIEMPEPIEVPAPVATVTVDDSDSETISTPVRGEAPTPAPARNDRQEPPRVREPVSAPAPDMDIKQSRFADVRGIRNNNPGNLRASRLASGKDDGFSTFATMVDGYRAMAEQLKMYGNAGLDNVASIVTKYAPASENNTSAYIDSVVSSMRKDLGTKELVATTSLDLGDRRVLKSLVDAMIDHENGSGASDYFNGSAYSAAIAAASQTTQKSRTVAEGDKIASTGGIVINQAISVTGQDAVAAAGTIARETKRQIARNSTSNLS